VTPLQLILGASVKTAETVDRLGERFAAELAQVLRSLERRLRPLVVDVAEGSRTSIVKASQANKARKAIEEELTNAGYRDLAESAYGDRLDRLVDRVLSARRLAQQSARLSGAFDARVAALKTLHETDLLEEGDLIARALWQAVIRGVFGARPVDLILQDLFDEIDASEAQIRTLYDTSVSIFGRQVEALQAGDDPEAVFAFMGPADKKNREFCRQHVGKVYTRADIDQLDNGQIDNVFLTGGGYNCRHSWIEVSKFSELQDYVGTDKRIPEVEQQLAELEQAA
jgi:hypothetical protein